MSAIGWQLVVDCRNLTTDQRELVMAELWSHPITAIEQRGGELVAGFDREHDAQTAANELTVPSAVVAVTDDSYLDEWRQFARPWTVGRLFVRPSWVAADPPDDGAIEIVVDPQRSFGSGGHASTRLALALLQRYDLRARAVLDVGCGSGVLAIAACALGASRVVAVDIDPAAVATTRENARRNGCGDRVDARVGSAVDVDATVDLVVVNVLPSVHRSIGPTVANSARIVIAAGLLEDQVDEVAAAYRARVHASAFDDGWAGLDLRVER